MSRKRPHTKSRHGCLQCKRRKIKCDESLPVCLRCQSRSEVCSLSENVIFKSSLTPASLAEQPQLIDTDVPFTPSPSIVSQVRGPLSELHSGDFISSNENHLDIRIEDLEFLQHFLLETCSTLVFTPEGFTTWQRYIPELALKNPFLLHCELATGALHKASTAASEDVRTRERCATAARAHQSKALSLCIPALSNASPENCVALCSFNILFALLPFGWQTLPKRPSWSSPGSPDCDRIWEEGGFHGPHKDRDAKDSIIDRFTQIANFWRGTDSIITQFWDWIQTSRIGNLFKNPDFDRLCENPPGATTALDLMAKRAERHTSPTSTPRQNMPTSATASATSKTRLRAIYDLELQRLYKACRCISNPEWGAYILSYPTLLSVDFAPLIQERDELALAMVAFWAACFHSLRDRWWAKGWSKALLDEVSTFLDHEWDDVLEWPRSVIESSGIVEVGLQS